MCVAVSLDHRLSRTVPYVRGCGRAYDLISPNALILMYFLDHRYALANHLRDECIFSTMFEWASVQCLKPNHWIWSRYQYC